MLHWINWMKIVEIMVDHITIIRCCFFFLLLSIVTTKTYNDAKTRDKSQFYMGNSWNSLEYMYTTSERDEYVYNANHSCVFYALSSVVVVVVVVDVFGSIQWWKILMTQSDLQSISCKSVLRWKIYNMQIRMASRDCITWIHFHLTGKIWFWEDTLYFGTLVPYHIYWMQVPEHCVCVWMCCNTSGFLSVKTKKQ